LKFCMLLMEIDFYMDDQFIQFIYYQIPRDTFWARMK